MCEGEDGLEKAEVNRQGNEETPGSETPWEGESLAFQTVKGRGRVNQENATVYEGEFSSSVEGVG